MGAQNLPRALTTHARARARARRACYASVLALLITAQLPAQSALSRDFERVFFARHECWLDRLLLAASPERRAKAIPHVKKALAQRGWADSMAGERSRLLARACAVLAGLDPDDSHFHKRFNFFLLALPEIVDPSKVERDRVLLGEITRRLYPLLRPVEVDDPKAPTRDRDRVFLTARGVFGNDKPKDLRVRFRVAPDKGDALEHERGDARDPNGWLLFDLVQSFELKQTGGFVATVGIGIAGDWPRPAADPVVGSRFWVDSGYHARFWKLLEMRKKIQEGQNGSAPRSIDLDRLAVVTDEALRVLLGKEFLLRAWPVQALSEATALAKTLLAGDKPATGARGDRIYGIKVADERILPLRVVWGTPGRPQRAVREGVLLMPPGGHDENWVIDGLGVPVADLQATGRVWAFAHYPTTGDYLRKAQALLRTELGVVPASTSLVGALDGSTRASYALGLLDTPLKEMVFIGGETPSLPLLREKEVGRLRVIPASGLPDAKALADLQRLVGIAQPPPGRLRVEEAAPRSFREALRPLMK